MLGRNGNDGWLFWALLGVSLAMHLGLAGHMLRQNATGDFGAIDSPTTAISVNIERTAILDAPDESRDSAASGQQAPAARQDYREETAREAAPPKPETENAERIAEEEATRAETERHAEQERLRLAEEALRKAEAAEREARHRRAEEERRIAEEEIRRKERAEAEERRRITREDDRKRKDQEDQRAQAQQDVAQGSAGVEASSGQVSASQGAMRKYGAVLQARVARRKPAGGGSGRVVIGFGLTTTGNLTYVRVVSSSGDNSLDERALGAIRAASPFPPPPPEARADQLEYTFPFTFR